MDWVGKVNIISISISPYFYFFFLQPGSFQIAQWPGNQANLLNPSHDPTILNEERRQFGFSLAHTTSTCFTSSPTDAHTNKQATFFLRLRVFCCCGRQNKKSAVTYLSSIVLRPLPMLPFFATFLLSINTSYVTRSSIQCMSCLAPASQLASQLAVRSNLFVN